jgi:hypothetical protein
MKPGAVDAVLQHAEAGQNSFKKSVAMPFFRRSAAFTPLHRRQFVITLKRAEARAPLVATVLVKPL